MAWQHVSDAPYDLTMSLLVLIGTAICLSILSLYLFHRKDIF
ncbi:hypothetical protein [Paenibacillus popilliae]|nr:hypothetical protein [Paenibacillus popilliae]